MYDPTFFGEKEIVMNKFFVVAAALLFSSSLVTAAILNVFNYSNQSVPVMKIPVNNCYETYTPTQPSVFYTVAAAPTSGNIKCTTYNATDIPTYCIYRISGTGSYKTTTAQVSTLPPYCGGTLTMLADGSVSATQD